MDYITYFCDHLAVEPSPVYPAWPLKLQQGDLQYMPEQKSTKGGSQGSFYFCPAVLSELIVYITCTHTQTTVKFRTRDPSLSYNRNCTHFCLLSVCLNEKTLMKSTKIELTNTVWQYNDPPLFRSCMCRLDLYSGRMYIWLPGTSSLERMTRQFTCI